MACCGVLPYQTSLLRVMMRYLGVHAFVYCRLQVATAASSLGAGFVEGVMMATIKQRRCATAWSGAAAFGRLQTGVMISGWLARACAGRTDEKASTFYQSGHALVSPITRNKHCKNRADGFHLPGL